MIDSWKIPVAHPLFTDALAQELVDAARAGVPYKVTLDVVSDANKPKAFDTRHRFSDNGCFRQRGYKDLEVPREVMDPASLHITFMGTVYHALLEPAIQRRHPDADVEVKAIIPSPTGGTSGHCDAILRINKTLFELKTKSTTQMDMATGNKRKGYTQKDPQGPSLDAIIQGALNARANGCNTLVIGYVCFENYGVPFARKFNLRQMDRFLAEWHIPPEVWEPLAEMEVQNLRQLDETIDLGYLPDRLIWDEDSWGETLIIGPDTKRPHWRCDYCDYVDRCLADGPGSIPIPVDIRKKDIA